GAENGQTWASCGFGNGYESSDAVRADGNRHRARTNTTQPEKPGCPCGCTESVVIRRGGLGTFEGEKLSLVQILEYGGAFWVRAAPDHDLRPAFR
ncbi:MAG: hypothetical protein ACXVZI_07680, partial [Terriglobales bacterium]